LASNRAAIIMSERPAPGQLEVIVSPGG
jgi:hypothetical protein